jgi:hypothetical protein
VKGERMDSFIAQFKEEASYLGFGVMDREVWKTLMLVLGLILGRICTYRCFKIPCL